MDGGASKQTTGWSEAPEKRKASPGRSARGVQAMPRRAEYLRKREARNASTLPQHWSVQRKQGPPKSQTETSKRNHICAQREDNQARQDVDEKTTRGPDERTPRTDSTDGLDERTRGRRRLTLADAAESAGKRTQASHPALESLEMTAARPTTSKWQALKQTANSKGGGRSCCSVKVNPRARRRRQSGGRAQALQSSRRRGKMAEGHLGRLRKRAKQRAEPTQ